MHRCQQDAEERIMNFAAGQRCQRAVKLSVNTEALAEVALRAGGKTAVLCCHVAQVLQSSPVGRVWGSLCILVVPFAVQALFHLDADSNRLAAGNTQQRVIQVMSAANDEQQLRACCLARPDCKQN